METLDQPTLFELILRQKLFAGVFIIFFILLTVELIRRRALKERYAILWLIASIVLLPIVLSHALIEKLSGVLGIAYAPLTILLTGIIFLIMINLHFSVALSRHRENEKKIAIKITEQEELISDLKKRIDSLEKSVGTSTDPNQKE